MNTQPIRNSQGELTVNIESLLGMAGHGPKTADWETEGGLVFLVLLGQRYLGVSPYLEKEVKHEAHLIIETARQWIHHNMRAFKRAYKLDDWDVVQLWKIGRKAEIIRVKLGETQRIKQSSGSYFGSGGSWGQWQEFGSITKDAVGSEDTGFVMHTEYDVTFDQGPAAVYTAAGDSINEGRVFWKELYIAE